MSLFSAVSVIVEEKIQQGKDKECYSPHSYALGSLEHKLGSLLYHIKYEYGEEAAQKALDYIKRY